jgi:hypothetical protein
MKKGRDVYMNQQMPPGQMPPQYNGPQYGAPQPPYQQMPPQYQQMPPQYGAPQQPPVRQKKGNKLSWIIILGIVGVIAAGFGIWAMVRTVQADPFSKELPSYAADFSVGDTSAPFTTGKMVIVNKTTKAVEDPYFDLPENLKATKPEEVGTIVQVTYEENQVGTYTSGSKAYQYTARVNVVDKATGKIVGRTTFKGGEPPSSVKRGSNGYGSRPTEQIKTYLVGLARK